MTFEKALGASVCSDGWWIALHEGLVLVDVRGRVTREIALRDTYVCAFSSDGHHALSVTEKGSELVDLKSGALVKLPLKLNGRFASLSRDGRKAAAASENEVDVWDLTEKVRLWRRLATDKVVAISSDGERVAYGPNPPGGIAIAAAAPKARAKKWAAQGLLTALCWRPDGTLVSAHGPAGVRLWAESVRQISGLAADLLVSSPRGDRLALRSEGSIHLVDVATGATREIGPGTTCAFAEDGLLVVGKTARLTPF